MKKNMVRVVALLLVAMLALTLIPLGAMALTFYVESETYSEHPTFDEWENYEGREWHWSEVPVTGNTSVTIKASNYKSYIVMPDGSEYDLQGIADWEKASKGDNDDKMAVSSSITFKAEDYKDVEYLPTAWLLYTPHKHALTGWISDGTTHWKNCTVCREKFIGQNWCQDGDEDKICNVCGGDVPYHDITAEGPDGYTVTLNRDNASHRTKITAKVDAPAGAQYKLHFIKVRTDGSEQEITRYKENGEFYTRMPTYPMKVVIEPIQ